MQQSGAMARKDADDATVATSHEDLKRDFLESQSLKEREQIEARQARRYYHGDHWTPDEIKVLNERKQPVITYNRTATKINGIVGLIEKLRQDPRAFPRNPQDDQSAEVATQVIRYGTDIIDFRTISSEAGLDGATGGIGVMELSLEPGDKGDPDISGSIVEPETFFYDPRSRRPDFSDAEFMGVSKWMMLRKAQSMFPDKATELDSGDADFGAATGTQDYDNPWTRMDGKRVRVVEHWFLQDGEWHWCFYTGDVELLRGASPFHDEKGRSFCRFIAFSANVDHEGDRYGFARNLKGPQDEVNHRRSKGLHALNTKQVVLEEGAVADIDETRRQVHRPDGVIVKQPNFEFEIVKNEADMQGNLALLQEAKTELDNYGPNPQLLGDAGQANSGRAIALLQQAGIAELGPYILQFRGWKLRVYRAIWSIVREHWTAERWLRVTDQENIAQFVQVNGFERDPFGSPQVDQNGQPVRVNHLGSLDVDIIVDEGPDSVNMMADTLDTLRNLGPNAGIPPAVFIELSPIPSSKKQQLLALINQPNPAQQQATQIQLAQGAANVEKTKSEAARNMAQAQQAMAPEQPQAPDAGPSDVEIMETMASADLKQAQAENVRQKTALMPIELAQKAMSERMRVEQSDRASERQVMARQQAQQRRQPEMSS